MLCQVVQGSGTDHVQPETVHWTEATLSRTLTLSLNQFCAAFKQASGHHLAGK